MPGTRPLALVTGASSGIGADLAREFTRHGHDVVLTARRVAPMETLAIELRAADRSKPGAVASRAGELDRRGLSVDLLVKNAGHRARGAVGESGAVHVSE